jgi:alkyldihydroxyacetonephosphate synthase
VDAWMKRALEICGDFGGTWDEASLSGGADADSGAKSWREKFLRGPYLREYAIARGVMRETMETAITWERFAKFREHVKSETHRAIREVAARFGNVQIHAHLSRRSSALLHLVRIRQQIAHS